MQINFLVAWCMYWMVIPAFFEMTQNILVKSVLTVSIFENIVHIIIRRSSSWIIPRR